MFTKNTLHTVLILAFVFTAAASIARDYIIYSIAQDLPMGEPNEFIKKNYYIDIGSEQGVEPGNKLKVYRSISRLDPYQSKKRYNYNVPIGTIEVIHVEQNSAIAKMHTNEINSKDSPYTEIKDFMIGDRVDIRVSE